MKKQTLILAATAAMVLNTGVAVADVSGNIGFGSNYIWRGFSQTKDQAAISGGVDYSHDSGLYAGTWVSNVDFSGDGDGYEQDYYVGFGGEAGGLGYDVGLVTYAYPVTPNANFTELYLSGSFNIITVGLSLTVDNAAGNELANGGAGVFVEDDMYVSVSADVTDSVSVYLGSYMFDNDGVAAVGEADYLHYGASISKDDFTFAVDKNDAEPAVYGLEADNVRFTVSWAKSFEL